MMMMLITLMMTRMMIMMMELQVWERNGILVVEYLKERVSQSAVVSFGILKVLIDRASVVNHDLLFSLCIDDMSTDVKFLKLIHRKIMSFKLM